MQQGGAVDKAGDAAPDAAIRRGGGAQERRGGNTQPFGGNALPLLLRGLWGTASPPFDGGRCARTHGQPSVRRRNGGHGACAGDACVDNLPCGGATAGMTVGAAMFVRTACRAAAQRHSWRSRGGRSHGQPAMRRGIGGHHVGAAHACADSVPCGGATAGMTVSAAHARRVGCPLVAATSNHGYWILCSQT